MTGYLIGNKTAHKITKVSRTLPQNTSEAVEGEIENNGLDREIAKRNICTSRTKIENYWWSKTNIVIL